MESEELIKKTKLDNFNRTLIKEGVCIICQKPFQPKRKNQICCSNICREVLSAWRKKESSYFYNNRYDKLETFGEFVDKKRKSIEQRNKYKDSQISLFPEGG